MRRAERLATAWRRETDSRAAVKAEGRAGWSPVGAILAAATLLALLLVHLLSLAEISSTRRWIIHTREVQAALTRIRAALVDAETEQRGFLLTGDAAYLEPFARVAWSLEGRFEEAKRRTADDPAQRRRVVELERLATARINDLRQAIQLYQAGRPAA